MKLIAIDVGFTATGCAIMERNLVGGWSCIELHQINTQQDDSRKSLRKAESDIQRMTEMARSLGYLVDRHAVTRAVVELPHGGARNGRAMRCMALASTAVAVLLDQRGLAIEYYSPNETRIAAVGRWIKVPKQEVIDAMTKLHPILATNPTEHLADALSCFEAAKAGNLVRL